MSKRKEVDTLYNTYYFNRYGDRDRKKVYDIISQGITTMRLFSTIDIGYKEIIRDLYSKGQTIITKSYQDKKLEGKEREVKELYGVDFLILNVDSETACNNMLEEAYAQEDIYNIKKYIQDELYDRVSTLSLNPGKSYKHREDVWQKFLHEGKFAYTYSQRINQYRDCIQVLTDTLLNDESSRQAILQIFDRFEDTNPDNLGGKSRIPCSMYYQYLIRNGNLHCIYNMRSCSAVEHMPVDLYLAVEMQKYILTKINAKQKEQGKELYDLGTLRVFVGSLHTFIWTIPNSMRL